VQSSRDPIVEVGAAECQINRTAAVTRCHSASTVLMTDSIGQDHVEPLAYSGRTTVNEYYLDQKKRRVAVMKMSGVFRCAGTGRHSSVAQMSVPAAVITTGAASPCLAVSGRGKNQRFGCG
jgi:hypothetical protein